MKVTLSILIILILNVSIARAQFFGDFEDIDSDTWSSFDLSILDELALVGGDDTDGGGWVSGGAGFNKSQDNIWYLGTGSMKYCYLRAEDYPINDQEIEDLIIESFMNWQNFFKKYEMVSNTLRVPTRKNYVLHGGSSSKMAHNFVSIGHCPKEENKGKVGEVLHLYFGVTNKIIDGYKLFSAETSLGVAIRPKFNHKTYRNGGYLWIGNVSSDKKRIKHLLLHELGHVFGMKHNSVFVMNEDVALEIKNEENLESSYFGDIEAPGWIYRFRDNDEIILTSFRGIKRKFGGSGFRNGRNNRNERRGQICEKFDYNQNSNLPQFILRKLSIKPLGCHRISLSLKEFPNAEFKKVFNLKINLLKGKTFEMQGHFNPIRPDQLNFQGPGIFTLWKDKNTSGPRGNVVWKRGIMDHTIPSVPSRGSFKFGKNKFAAKILNSKGTQIEIFFPKAGRWWVLSSVHNNLKGK